MSSILLSHSGKQHAYWVAYALQQCGALGSFHTSSYYLPDCRVDRWLHRIPPVARFYAKRYQNGLDAALVRRAPALEWPELAYRTIFGNDQFSARLVELRDTWFDRLVSRRLRDDGKPHETIFWGFQGSCLQSLMTARAQGMVAMAEFATAHVLTALRLLSREAEKHPDWADSIGNLNFSSGYRERLEAEPLHADICISASSFTTRSLEEAGVPKERIQLLPLGADLEQFRPPPYRADGPFRILFVGSLGQRKGLKYLLEAVQMLGTKEIELSLVGPRIGSGRGLRAYKKLFSERGSLSGGALVREYQRSDVLVLPSVLEGFGLVIVEAMATGIPVIASTHTCAPDVIRDGIDGFVLEPDDVEGIARRLDWLATNRRESNEMGKNAAKRSRAFSWDCHAQRVAEFVEQRLESRAEI